MKTITRIIAHLRAQAHNAPCVVEIAGRKYTRRTEIRLNGHGTDALLVDFLQDIECGCLYIRSGSEASVIMSRGRLPAITTQCNKCQDEQIQAMQM